MRRLAPLLALPAVLIGGLLTGCSKHETLHARTRTQRVQRPGSGTDGKPLPDQIDRVH